MQNARLGLQGSSFVPDRFAKVLTSSMIGARFASDIGLLIAFPATRNMKHCQDSARDLTCFVSSVLAKALFSRRRSRKFDVRCGICECTEIGLVLFGNVTTLSQQRLRLFGPSPCCFRSWAFGLGSVLESAKIIVARCRQKHLDISTEWQKITRSRIQSHSTKTS